MKNCLRIPRVFLPRNDVGLWAAPFCRSQGEWESAERAADGAPSVLRFLLPPASDDEAARIEAMRESMYHALESEWLEKLNRGFILTERTTSCGVRRGMVASFDLEQFSWRPAERAMIRPVSEADAARVASLAAARKHTPLEFPHTLIVYRGKKRMKKFSDLDLELLYDFDLPQGGRLTGRYLPDYIAWDAAQEMHGRGEPCFAVVDAVEEAAAAKERWEALKPALKQEELANHPARFSLAEFVDLNDDGLRFSDGAGREFGKEKLFSALKDGKLLPRGAFSLSDLRDGRYALEGREIGYD